MGKSGRGRVWIAKARISHTSIARLQCGTSHRETSFRRGEFLQGHRTKRRFNGHCAQAKRGDLITKSLVAQALPLTVRQSRCTRFRYSDNPIFAVEEAVRVLES